MAERRMFAKTIIDSDAFLDMPATTQNLYFHLSMRADDEGFINKPKAIMRLVGASQNDIELLGAKKFIIPFESGVVVIKHWKIHNYIRGDRLQPTKYGNEKAMLSLDDNNAYTTAHGRQLTDRCQTSDRQMTDKWHTEDRLGKDRLGKDSNNNIYTPITDYLNQLTGSSYRATSRKTRSLIDARVNEGFTVDDFKTVIYKKSKQWGNDPHMVKYLRPETLFGTKFESYLNEVEVIDNKSKALEEWLND